MSKKSLFLLFLTFFHKLESNSKCSHLRNDYLLLAVGVESKYCFLHSNIVLVARDAYKGGAILYLQLETHTREGQYCTCS